MCKKAGKKVCQTPSVCAVSVTQGTWEKSVYDGDVQEDTRQPARSQV